MPRSTICSSGAAGTFYWRGCVSGRHVRAAVDFLMAALESAPNRVWKGPYLKADTRAALTRRIQAAERGHLRIDEEWRPIYLDPDLYEIRWTDVAVTEVVNPLTGAAERRTVHVRLYYAEDGPARWFIGLHGHEKLLSGSQREIDDRQDREIQVASDLYKQWADDAWGVPELQKRP